MRIVPQDIWDAVRQRRAAVRKSWPGDGKRGFTSAQGKRGSHFPTHLLSGTMTCASCGSTIGQVAGKSGGYFGCLGAKKGTCNEKIMVRRKLTEKIILDKVRELVSAPEQIRKILKKVEQEIVKEYSDVPKLIRQKELELSSEKRSLANFVEFIAEGRGSHTIGKALEESERKVNALQKDVDGLRKTSGKVFQAPPIEWIEERLTQIQSLLEQNTKKSSQTLRNLIGPIKFKATYPDIGKPYFVAQTSVNALAIVENPSVFESADNGSTTYLWWRWRGSNPRP